jgi:hypothetical protein
VHGLLERLVISATEIHEHLLSTNFEYRTLVKTTDLYKDITDGGVIILTETGVLMDVRTYERFDKPMNDTDVTVARVHLATDESEVLDPPRIEPFEESKSVRVMDAIDALLRERGDMHRRDLAAALFEANVLGHAKDPVNMVARYLTLSDGRFESRGGGVWGLPRTQTN